MKLSDMELADARVVIQRALDEDLRYGPDITTAATVPDGEAVATLATRQAGVWFSTRFWGLPVTRC
jgi:nicotinate-nucleotide pyrophosphorylase (carboxylating)